MYVCMYGRVAGRIKTLHRCDKKKIGTRYTWVPGSRIREECLKKNVKRDRT